MAQRKVLPVSLPPALDTEVKKLARRQHQTVSELVRAALRLYLDQVERDAAFKRALAFGKTRAKAMGVRSQAQLQGILDELRHGKDSAKNASETAGRR
jgi:Arc/MetJ-type ribon-helix-helix transcriptional regulator